MITLSKILCRTFTDVIDLMEAAFCQNAKYYTLPNVIYYCNGIQKCLTLKY